jgi:hypothetical protein
MTAPSNTVILRRTLLWSAIVTVVIGVVGALIGLAVDGAAGVYSALVGVGMAAVFLGLTAAIMLIAQRFHQPDNPAVYFGIVLGGWALKIVVFLVGILLLRGQDWLNGYVFFFSVLASVIASLVIDMVVLAKTRVSYASHVGTPQNASEDPADAPQKTA